MAKRMWSLNTDVTVTIIWNLICFAGFAVIIKWNFICFTSDNNDDNISLEDYDDADIEKVDLKKTKKRKDSYDFIQSSQMHGN